MHPVFYMLSAKNATCLLVVEVSDIFETGS